MKITKYVYEDITGFGHNWHPVTDDGELESKYQARYNIEEDLFELDHWGTNIITLENVSSDDTKVAHIYGQSKSDRDAIMFVFKYFDCKDFSVSYKPSRDEFHCFVTFVGKKEPQEFII